MNSGERLVVAEDGTIPRRAVYTTMMGDAGRSRGGSAASWSGWFEDLRLQRDAMVFGLRRVPQAPAGWFVWRQMSQLPTPCACGGLEVDERDICGVDTSRMGAKEKADPRRGRSMGTGRHGLSAHLLDPPFNGHVTGETH